jgi:pimeloyl-ACP methyl ester carboxylesterase
MGGLAAEYAEVLRLHFPTPVDLVGASTGGSIAQQLAADHPDIVRRLVLISTACRLGPVGREEQARVAESLRAGQMRSAASLVVGSLSPRGLRPLARSAGWLSARWVLPENPAVADLAATIEAEDEFDLAACARPIEADTLIVVGGRDRFYSRALFEETATLIPKSVLKLYARRGHITVTTDRRAQATIAGFLTAP